MRALVTVTSMTVASMTVASMTSVRIAVERMTSAAAMAVITP